MAVSEPLSKRADVLELVVKIAALIAVVLPIIGAGVRAIAFFLAGVPDALDLATRLPVGGLVSTALKPLGTSLSAIALLFFLAYSDRPRPGVEPGSSQARRGWNLALKGPSWVYTAVGVLLLTLVAVAVPWPGGLVSPLAWGIAGYKAGWWSSRRELTFYRLAFVVIVAGIASAAGAGINGIAVGDEVNSYTFVKSAPSLADGRYAMVGESDGFLYLQSCQQSGIVGVPLQEVASFSAAKTQNWFGYLATSPSLLEIVLRGASPKFGYSPGC